MRGLRTTLAAAWILGLAPAITLAGANATVEQLLAYRPTQKGVDYEVPTTPAAIFIAARARSRPSPTASTGTTAAGSST